jgi:hypothetical protein
MSIGTRQPPDHFIRVRTPGGDAWDLDGCGQCGAKRASLLARRVAGWLADDRWAAHEFPAPAAVEELRDDLEAAMIDPAACVVEVVVASPVADAFAPHGWRVVEEVAVASMRSLAGSTV